MPDGLDHKQKRHTLFNVPIHDRDAILLSNSSYPLHGGAIARLGQVLGPRKSNITIPWQKVKEEGCKMRVRAHFDAHTPNKETPHSWVDLTRNILICVMGSVGHRTPLHRTTRRNDACLSTILDS